jgi:hypothetical protein
MSHGITGLERVKTMKKEIKLMKNLLKPGESIK